MIPLIGEMSAKQTKGCPNSENFAPAVSAPSERGLSNAQHLTGGEIFSFLSLRLLPAAKATSLREGGDTGRRLGAPL